MNIDELDAHSHTLPSCSNSEIWSVERKEPVKFEMVVHLESFWVFKWHWGLSERESETEAKCLCVFVCVYAKGRQHLSLGAFDPTANTDK